MAVKLQCQNEPTTEMEKRLKLPLLTSLYKSKNTMYFQCRYLHILTNEYHAYANMIVRKCDRLGKEHRFGLEQWGVSYKHKKYLFISSFQMACSRVTSHTDQHKPSLSFWVSSFSASVSLQPP